MSVTWHIPEPAIHRKWPLQVNGQTDFFALDPGNAVTAGQILASVDLPDAQSVPPLIAGHGVRVSDDGREYFTGIDGFVQFTERSIVVHGITVIQTDLTGGEHEYSGTVVIRGDVRASRIAADGHVAVSGLVAGATIQAGEGIHITRAGRSTLCTEGDLYFSGTLRQCDVVACGNIVSADEATLVGGCATAGAGLNLANAGSPEGAPTEIAIGSNRLNAFRLDEVEVEINAYKQNIHRIAQALRMACTDGQRLPPEKKRLVDALAEQRERMEERVQSLYAQKRGALLSGYSSSAGAVAVRGTAHPGVKVSIHGASIVLESAKRSIQFKADLDGAKICETTIEADSLAA